MLLNTVHHVAIIVSDYEKSREFYVDKLELPIIRENYREARDDYKLDLQVGDIALFRYHEAHVLHRVVEIAGNQITFAGDGNIGQMEQAKFDEVIASAESIILPNGRVVACHSREWRLKSRIWLLLPRLARRIVLAIMHRI